jgi:ribosomal protein L9
VPVDRKNVLLLDPIKQLGDYKVKIKAGTDLHPEISVSVVAES